MRVKFLVGLFAAAILAAVGGIYVMSSSQSYLTPRGVATASGAITGQVIDVSGQPVSGAQVYADRNEAPIGRRLGASTDEQGMFVIDNLVPGTYTVSTSKEEDGYAPTDTSFYVGYVQAPQVTVNERQTTSGVLVPLGPQAARLTGRIIDTTTNAVMRDLRDVQITLRHADNPDYALSTNPVLNGAFSILVPIIPFTVEVSAPGYQHWQYREAGSTPQPNILQLASGQTRRLDIALRRIR